MPLTFLLTTVFALGVVLGIVLAYRRVQKTIDASPWETPRTHFIAGLRREGQRAAFDVDGQLTGASAPVGALAPVAVLDSFTIWSGVALFESGARVLPDGTHVGYFDAVRFTTDALRSACVSLHDAAELLRQTSDALPYEQFREYRRRNMDAVIRVDRALGFDRADQILAAARRGAALEAEAESPTSNQRDLWVAQ